MAFHEWPLVIFTVFAQTAVGAFLVMSVANLVTDSRVDVKSKMTRNLFFVWVFMALGFMASTAHLGSPVRAMNALNKVGSSWLSNEILTGSLFFAFGGFYWLLDVLNKGSETLRKALMVLGMVAGVAFMYSMVNVYLINTVPTWDTPYTWWSFLLTMTVSGSLLALILISNTQFEHRGFVGATRALVVLGVVALIVTTVGQVVSLSDIQSSVVAASDLVANLGCLQGIRIVMLLVGAAMALMCIQCEKGNITIAIIGFALVLFAELLGRTIFFNLHMTVGM